MKDFVEIVNMEGLQEREREHEKIVPFPCVCPFTEREREIIQFNCLNALGQIAGYWRAVLPNDY